MGKARESSGEVIAGGGKGSGSFPKRNGAKWASKHEQADISFLMCKLCKDGVPGLDFSAPRSFSLCFAVVASFVQLTGILA